MVWENCQIGSCHRHKSCMYTPCRSVEPAMGNQMTYPDDVLKAAREALGTAYEQKGFYIKSEDVLSGVRDATPEVQAACIAIMAERQRCAGVATVTETGSGSQWEQGYEAAAKHIKQAILGQQEAEK